MFSGRDSRYLFKYLTEIVGIIKAQHIRDLIHQILVCINQFLGVFDFHCGNIIGQCAAGKLLKGVAQMAGADVQTVSDISQGQLFHVMLVYIGSGLLHQLIGTGGLPVVQQPAELAAEALEPGQNIGQAVKLIEPSRHIDRIGKDIPVAVIRALKI